MSGQGKPRPPGSAPKIHFSNAQLHRWYLEAGTRRHLKRCPRCLEEADIYHRAGFLHCKGKCVLCDKMGHNGKVCPLMESEYASFFTRSWWADHCDLGGVCPWEENGLENLQEVGDLYSRSQNASSASGTNQGPRRDARSKAPRGQYRNDRDNRSRSPAYHGSNNNGRSRGRNDYRHERSSRGGQDDGRRRRDDGGPSNAGFANADSYWPREAAAPPAPLAHQPTGSPPRLSARRAILAERLRQKRQPKEEPEAIEIKTELGLDVISLQEQMPTQRAEMEQQFQQNSQEQLKTQRVNMEQQFQQNLQEQLQMQRVNMEQQFQQRLQVIQQQLMQLVQSMQVQPQYVAPMGPPVNHVPAARGHEVDSNVKQGADSNGMPGQQTPQPAPTPALE